MENISTAPVIEPENMPEPKKKLGKPEIFMILAVIFGGTPYFSSIFSTAFSRIVYSIAEEFPEIITLISTVANGVISNVFSVIFTVISVIVYVLFAYFSYKKFRKALRFLGAVFAAETLMSLLDRTWGVFSKFVTNLSADVGLKIAPEDLSMVMLVITTVVTMICLIVSAAAGVIILMIFEGKIKIQKKEKSPASQENISENPAIEPENNKPKKKKLGKPEVFMLLSLILAQGVLNIGLNFIQSIVTTVLNMIYPMFVSGSGDYVAKLICDTLFNITNYVFDASEIILGFAVIVVFAFMAYKKMKRRAAFIGIAFAATKISWLLAYGPLSSIRNIISTIVSAVCMQLMDEGSLSFQDYSTILIVQSTVVGLSEFVFMFIGMAVAAVSGLLILMAVNGKLKKKKKEPEAVETSEITETY